MTVNDGDIMRQQKQQQKLAPDMLGAFQVMDEKLVTLTRRRSQTTANIDQLEHSSSEERIPKILKRIISSPEGQRSAPTVPHITICPTKVTQIPQTKFCNYIEVDL